MNAEVEVAAVFPAKLTVAVAVVVVVVAVVVGHKSIFRQNQFFWHRLKVGFGTEDVFFGLTEAETREQQNSDD